MTNNGSASVMRRIPRGKGAVYIPGFRTARPGGLVRVFGRGVPPDDFFSAPTCNAQPNERALQSHRKRTAKRTKARRKTFANSLLTA